MPELSVFDERLAEIDRRLRSIQSELDADLAPGAALHPAEPTDPAESEATADAAAVVLPPPTPLRAGGFATPPPAGGFATPPPASEPTALPPTVLAELRELRAAHERLLELHGELLGQYAETLERRTAGAGTATVTAGPFADPQTLRDFERRLAALPGVDAVSVREFLGADRVAIDVRLA